METLLLLCVPIYVARQPANTRTHSKVKQKKNNSFAYVITIIIISLYYITPYVRLWSCWLVAYNTITAAHNTCVREACTVMSSGGSEQQQQLLLSTCSFVAVSVHIELAPTKRALYSCRYMLGLLSSSSGRSGVEPVMFGGLGRRGRRLIRDWLLRGMPTSSPSSSSLLLL